MYQGAAIFSPYAFRNINDRSVHFPPSRNRGITKLLPALCNSTINNNAKMKDTVMPTPDPVPEELKQVQAKFDEAAKLRVSPCSWLPPKWSELQNTAQGRKKFKDTEPDLPSFDNNDAAKDRIEQGQTVDRRDVDSPETVPSSEPGRKPG